MNTRKYVAFLALLCFGLASFCAMAKEDSIYDVVNREDTDAFSDMVVLGYDIDDIDRDGYTPLMIAASLGKANFARFLIYNDANVNKRSHTGQTALHRAAQGGYDELVNMLIDAGAYVNIPDFAGNTPLMYAVMSNHLFTVERLIAAGANLGYRNANGETALRIAEKKRFFKIVNFLRSKGAR